MSALLIRRFLVSACSLGALAVALPAPAPAAEAAAEQPGTVGPEDILVIGTRYTLGIQAERDLDQAGIESYGESTIDELIAAVQGELGDDEQPLILVNGERVADVSEIGSLPVEALENVKVLPRGSGVRAGGRSRQRVISLTLKKQTRSGTALVARKVSTDGGWAALRGEGILTYIRGDTRANLTLKARGEDDLLESERDIDQPALVPAYAQGGNVVGFPDTAGEIDPALSAAAGETVTVAAIPDLANPTLLDFVPGANDPAMTNLGDFRTLRPRTENYDLNATFATRLAPWLTGSASLRLGHSTRRSLRGLPQALFVLSPSNPSSPFSTSVGLAEYGQRPLVTRSERDSVDANLTLNGRFGEWASFFNARWFQSIDNTRTQRRDGSGTIVLSDSTNPFASDPFGLVTLRTDEAEGRNRTATAKLSATGPLLALPAGDLQLTLEGQHIANRLRSHSDTAAVQDRTFSRRETGLRAAVEVPLTSSEGFGARIGDLNATGEVSLVHYSDAGDISGYALGLAWEPWRVLRLSADRESSGLPASVQLLGNPVIVTSGVRTFDPLTGESVDVTQITGGNPDLDAERTTTTRFAALVRLVQKHNLQFSAEYTDSKERNFVSFLPEASAAVMLAFPERFLRDGDGTLTAVDLRPVNFDEHREQRLRYGFSLGTRLGAAARGRPGDSAGGEGDEDMRPARRAADNGPLRLQAAINHSVVFKDEIIIRPGLDRVDLLDGGAIGIGGGRVRHQLDGNVSLSRRGMGLRVTANWRGPFTLESRIGGVEDELDFSPVLLVNARVFTDLRHIFPNSGWARGMRLSLNADNLFNDRQEVRDSAGNTPLQYQPGYRDALGRTVEVELRKRF